MITKCALVVGHRLSAKGATNKKLFSQESSLTFEDFGNFNIYLQNRIENENYTVTEYDFNDILARLISQYVTDTQVTIIYRDDNESGYANLPKKINEINPDFVVSLHENAFNTKTSGTEMLYYYSSSRGKKIAKIFQQEVEKFFNFNNRGIKGITHRERGGYLLHKTHAPAIICEPFFIDNNYDLAKALYNYDDFAKLYAKAIDRVTEEVFNNIIKTEFKAKELPSNILERIGSIPTAISKDVSKDEEIEDLINKLKNKDDTKLVEDVVFYESAEKLGLIGKRAVKPLIEILDSSDEYEVSQALYALRLVAQNENVLKITKGIYPKSDDAIVPKDSIEYMKKKWKEWFKRFQGEF